MVRLAELVFVFRGKNWVWSDCLLFFDKLVGYMQFLVRGSLRD